MRGHALIGKVAISCCFAGVCRCLLPCAVGFALEVEVLFAAMRLCGHATMLCVVCFAWFALVIALMGGILESPFD